MRPPPAWLGVAATASLVAAALGLSASVAGKPDPTRARATGKPARWSPTVKKAAIAAGQALIKAQQCTRCHEIDGLPSTGRAYDCVKCHDFLMGLSPGQPVFEKIAQKHGRDVLDRYRKNIVHFRTIPNLTGLGGRLRPDWVAGFLAAPHDVRPLLDESMIRNRLTPTQIKTLVRYFAAAAGAPDPYPGRQARPVEPVPAPRASKARIAAGRTLFSAKGCRACHVFGNDDFGAPVPVAVLEAMRSVAALAPNLRFARDRMTRDVLVAAIVDPQSVAPASRMPNLAVPRTEAEAIADFLLFAPAPKLPPPVSAAAALALPAAAKHAVRWAEVKERVLGKVCVHCHMNDHEQDTGPGNGGGLGYSGLELSFRTYERAVYGARGKDGKRHSVFETQPGEPMPRILLSMMRRRVENRRDHLPPLGDRVRPPFTDGPGAHVLGMPLGLPAMTDEEIGILRRWIEDGCPGPTAISGKPGFDDGFLVPDGPIADNHGCDVRKPAAKRPVWAVK